ncbi:MULTISPECIES: DUF2846 domain-containing protein [unclassified Achromobacter]|uniref:DUF2846 domain-containing protein n=1 Tax=unclassified Achromobacter TaxID=2626865 RepID=UPI001C4757F5|nr:MULTISPECIES: DUF2846 domain-containing protein [unclassified Achromobacter]MBV7500791.1 DUF2846 domain-containing protein [Achromobacter sp. ACM05]
MKNWIKLSLAALGAATLLAGCAGPRYADVSAKISALEPGEGRIYFYQPKTANGDKVRPPAILVDNARVGKSKAGHFFFVDRAAGTLDVITSTDRKERKDPLVVPLVAGQTQYVRVDIDGGKQVLRLEPSAEAAQQALSGLRYWGATNREREALRY